VAINFAVHAGMSDVVAASLLESTLFLPITAIMWNNIKKFFSRTWNGCVKGL
jgi:hypothetical protein